MPPTEQQGAGPLRRLFDHYAADLEALDPALGGRFQCPQCLTVIAPVEPLQAVVAEEHVVPSALGGTTTTLTCRSCNNNSGSGLEADLVQRAFVDSGKRLPRTVVRIADTEVRGELAWPEAESEPISIAVIKKQTDPRQVVAQQGLIRPGMPDIHLTSDWGYVPQKTHVALLRAAYLLMFRYFGYRYITDRSAQDVRDQIQDWRRDSNVLRGVLWRFNTEHVFTKPSILVVREPQDLVGFLVLLPLDTRRGHVAAVLLPPPGSDGREFYGTALAHDRFIDMRATPLNGQPTIAPFVSFVL